MYIRGPVCDSRTVICTLTPSIFRRKRRLTCNYGFTFRELKKKIRLRPRGAHGGSFMSTKSFYFIGMISKTSKVGGKIDIVKKDRLGACPYPPNCKSLFVIRKIKIIYHVNDGNKNMILKTMAQRI